MKLFEGALLSIIFLFVSCSSFDSSGEAIVVKDVTSLTDNVSAYAGKTLSIRAYVIPGRHGMLMTDSPMAHQGIQVFVPNNVTKHKDVDRFLSIARKSWLGESIRIQGAFTGTIVRNEDAPGWSFQLISVQEASELPAPPETNQEHAPNPF